MKISTVTVCYNSRSSIGRTVESFLQQNYSNKELLVVDGGSHDGTVDIIKSFGSDAVRIISERDNGIYDAMNKGLMAFGGDAVGFLNSDDTYHDNTVLSRIAEGLGKADLVYGDLVMISDHTTKIPLRNWRAGSFIRGSFRTGWMPPHPTFYVRRELAQRVGHFDLSYQISADYDFMLRAMELGDARAHYIAHTLVDFMVGGRSTSGLGAVIRGNLECMRARRKNLRTAPVDLAFVSKPLQKLRQIKWRNLP
jgi:glycosyltransferase